MSRAASQTQLVHAHRKLDTANGFFDAGEGYSMEAFSIFPGHSSDFVPCEIQQSRQHLRESRTAPHCWHLPSIRALQEAPVSLKESSEATASLATEARLVMV